jgi:hypothetical protein
LNLLAYPLGAVIGIVLALVICASAALAGFSRERSFYPVTMIVIASYYVLFAVMAAATSALWYEIAVALAFSGLAIAGFKKSAWFVVAALVAHGVFDAIHGHVIANPGVPAWWPAFCMTFDITMGLVVAARLLAARRAG